MKFDEAYQKMKEGKVMMVRENGKNYKFYRMKNDIVEVRYGYDGDFEETYLDINTFIHYDFYDEDAYTFDFIEAMKKLIQGHKIQNECTKCSYVIENGELKCFDFCGVDVNTIWFSSDEIQFKWRVVE